MTPPFRVGHGYDLHRLRQGGTLMLGGVAVSTELSPVAHSDGDVVLHAIVDALLGAMGWGDIGEHFSDTDPAWKGAASRVFVETVRDRVTAARIFFAQSPSRFGRSRAGKERGNGTPAALGVWRRAEGGR